MGTISMGEWDRYGPKDNKSIQDSAVLLNHLIHSRVMPCLNVDEYCSSKEKGHRSVILSIFQKLMRAANPKARCHVEIQPCNTSRTVNRDMTFNDADFNADFRLNSRVNIGYYFTGIKGSVEVIIFDLGTTGKLTALMPDQIQSEGRIGWFPDAHRNQSITLTGSTGLETVFAIATQKGLGLRSGLHLDKKIAEEFTGQESVKLIERLANSIGDYPKESWGIGVYEFEIRR